MYIQNRRDISKFKDCSPLQLLCSLIGKSPYKFIDMESGETIKLNPNEVRDFYTSSSKSYIEKLKLKCGQYKINFVEADVHSDFKNILIPYLIKRRKLH